MNERAKWSCLVSCDGDYPNQLGHCFQMVPLHELCTSNEFDSCVSYRIICGPRLIQIFQFPSLHPALRVLLLQLRLIILAFSADANLATVSMIVPATCSGDNMAGNIN